MTDAVAQQNEMFVARIGEVLKNRGGKAHYREIASSLGIKPDDVRVLLKKMPGMRHLSHGVWTNTGPVPQRPTRKRQVPSNVKQSRREHLAKLRKARRQQELGGGVTYKKLGRKVLDFVKRLPDGGWMAFGESDHEAYIVYAASVSAERKGVS